MIDFPNNPTVGQQFTSAGVTWTWDGFKWTAAGLNVAYLPLAGGTMLGPLTLQANPVGNLDAAPKQYVDALSMGYPLGDNRIINGDMRIDQRNNGAPGAAIGYTADRWSYIGTQASKVQWQRTGGSGLAGFPYNLGFNVTAYAPLAGDTFYVTQIIEADMISDFAWGTAQAQPVTLQFWTASSLTGAFSGAICNDNAGVPSRSYCFAFSIPVANVWTKVTVTIPGDTTGLWAMSGNGIGAQLRFDLGTGATYRAAAGWHNGNFVGVNGSVNVVAVSGGTFNLTGVKLEIGSVATPFNRQSLAKSMADCQRYYSNTVSVWYSAYMTASNNFGLPVAFPTTMRASPTVTFNTPSYVNASGLAVAFGPSLNNVSIYAVATATGPANFNFNSLILNAEL